MISKNTTNTIKTLDFANLLEFIRGFLRARPSLENPYWHNIAKIIENRKEEFENELGTSDPKEICKILSQ